jgi:hypothetical protein
MKSIVLDGVTYNAETELQKEAKKLLNEVYGTLWIEAFCDSHNASTQKFSEPLSRKMTRLNNE